MAKLCRRYQAMVCRCVKTGSEDRRWFVIIVRRVLGKTGSEERLSRNGTKHCSSKEQRRGMEKARMVGAFGELRSDGPARVSRGLGGLGGRGVTFAGSSNWDSDGDGAMDEVGLVVFQFCRSSAGAGLQVCVVLLEWRLKVDRDGRCGSTGEEKCYSGYRWSASAEQAEVTGQQWLMCDLPNLTRGTEDSPPRVLCKSLCTFHFAGDEQLGRKDVYFFSLSLMRPF